MSRRAGQPHLTLRAHYGPPRPADRFDTAAAKVSAR
jgi:hypothetical protein